jgi:hypothetical protein
MLRKWIKPPFNRFIDYIDETDRILYLCMQGLVHMTKLPALAEAVIDFDPQSPESTEPEERAHLEGTHQRAKFSAEEIERGFPVLHAHAVVALWAALEALVSDLMVTWLLNESAVLSNGQFAKIRMPLAEYERLAKDERMAFLVSELARSLNASFKPGIAKFEALLGAIDLGGAVEDDVRRTLLELSQVRNIIVHRAGVIDSRFREACPWLGLEVGVQNRVTHEQYLKYSQASHNYALCIINRVRVKDGLAPRMAKQNAPIPVVDETPTSDGQ